MVGMTRGAESSLSEQEAVISSNTKINACLLYTSFKLGAVIKFIPYPIIVGFTSGIAVTIFTTQIADIFGLSFGDEKVPGDFVGKWMIYFRHFDTINWWNTIVSFASIIIIAITPKFSKKIHGSLIAIIVVLSLIHILT